MSVYGMGSLFCGTEEQLDNFVNEGFVCIGWKKEDKPELYAILNNIKIGISFTSRLFHSVQKP